MRYFQQLASNAAVYLTDNNSDFIVWYNNKDAAFLR